MVTKCVSLNSEPCMSNPVLINLNHYPFNYYPIMFSLDKYNGSCNNVENYLQK